MALATQSPPRPVDASVLRTRLAALRGRLRRVHLVRGVGLVVGLTLLGLLAAGFLDFYWPLPSLVRAILLAGCLVGASLVAIHYLILPLRARTDDLTLALMVEEHYPTLNDCLATAVQFMDQGENAPEGESGAMRRSALRMTMQKAAGCDFLKVINARGMRLAGLLGFATVSALVALVWLYPTESGTAAVRLLDPFGGYVWPSETQIALEKPPPRTAINQAFEIKGTVTGVVPSEGKLLLRQSGFGVREVPIKIHKDNDSQGRILIRLPDTQVQNNFDFKVLAHDGATPWHSVTVSPPPTYGLLDGKPCPQVRLDYPTYSDLPSPRYLVPGIGHIEAIAGTVVTVRGAASAPLKRAWIELKYDPRTLLKEQSYATATIGLPLAALGATLPLGIAPPALLAEHLSKPVEGELSDDATKFTCKFQPLLSGEYIVHMEDDLGLRGSKPYELRLRPDPAPLVQLERPSASRDLLIALPGAELPVHVIAEDTTFALRSVFLRYRTHRDAAPRKLFIYSEPLARRLVGTYAGIAVATQAPHYRPTRIEMRQMLPLRAVKHPDGTPLKDGDTLFLQACADDFDEVNPNKEPGASHEVEVKIVDRNRLDIALHQEQGKIQQEILRQRERQREVLKQVQAFKSKVDKGEKLNQDEARALLEAEREQGVLQEKIGTPKEGLRGEVAKVLETLKQNGMQNSAVRDRMTDIAAELERVAEKELPKIQAALTEARKALDRAENPQDRKESADRVRREAQARQDRAEALKRNDASVLEQAAEKLDQQAKEAETKGNIDKARELRTEADQLRKQAQELQKNPVNPEQKGTKDEIAKLEQQARDLKEAADKLEQPPAQTPEDAARKNLADARAGQDEVERTLTDLLSRLEPWANSREIQGEARKLLQEEKAIEQKAAALEKMQGGKELKNLTPEEKIEKNNLAEEQKKLEERVNQLVQKMENVAKERQEKDPEGAKELRNAAELARQENIAGKMKQAREQINDNKLNDARQNQKAAAESLDKVVQQLKNRDEAQLDRLVKKMKEVEAQLEKVQDDLERLKKQRKEAEKIADPQQRAAELQRLQKEQERIAQQGQQALEQLAKLRAERGGRGIEQANQKLEEAVKQLQRREMMDMMNPDQALDRIEEARQEVERAREQAEEELAREQLVRVMDTLKRLKERQDARVADAKTLWEELLQQQRWTLSGPRRLLALSTAEEILADETGTVATRDLDRAPVFARMVQRAADAMKEASQRATKVAKEKPALDKLPDEELDRQLALAARRLEQVLKAVQDEVDSPQAGGGGGGGQDMGGGEGGRSQPGDHIPPLAQLKLLRVLEKDVRQQLTDFRKDHPDANNLDKKAKARYQSILKQRQDVRELFEELNRPADEPEAKPLPEIKPEPKPEGGKP